MLGLLTFLTISILGAVCKATPCFPGSTWPRLIGYGIADTEVRSIDRRDSDGALALMILSGEADLIANAGSSTNTRIYGVFDPNTDDYLWLKVIQNVINGRYSGVSFSPDGSKVLAIVNLSSGPLLSFIYFDPTTGQRLGGS